MALFGRKTIKLYHGKYWNIYLFAVGSIVTPFLPASNTDKTELTDLAVF
jgi:hypothetical protein